MIESFSPTPSRHLETKLASASPPDKDNSSKKIVLIRHGLSYMNEYIGANGITFGGPHFTDIFSPDDHENFYRDSPLSAIGQDQAKELGKVIELQLKEQDSAEFCLKNLELVVVSPLTRAIQTAQLALLSHLDSVSTSAIPVIALPQAAERLYLVSDIGRPKAELEEKYGNQVDFQTSFAQQALDAPWWYQANESDSAAVEWRPIGQGQTYFCPGEPYDAFQQRMLDLCEWLEERPETTIALVGHYGVFEWLLQGNDSNGEKVKFDNCEMKVVAFETIMARVNRSRTQ